MTIDATNKRTTIPVDGSKPSGMASNGVKLDAGKVRFDLLPPDALHAVAQVYTFGAEKYEPRNWEKGMDWGRVYAAGQRHMNSFWGGEARDQETGFLHTAHAAFAALTLTSYQLRSIGADSRNELLIPGFGGPVTVPQPIAFKRVKNGIEISDAAFSQLLTEAGRM